MGVNSSRICIIFPDNIPECQKIFEGLKKFLSVWCEYQTQRKIFCVGEGMLLTNLYARNGLSSSNSGQPIFKNFLSLPIPSEMY